MKNFRFLFLTFFLFYSCKNNSTEDACENLEKKLINISEYKISETDSLIFYIDEILENCKPNNFTLLTRKLNLLFGKKKYAEMIPVYGQIFQNDSSKIKLYNFEFGKFYAMALSDSIKYKEEMKKYYEKVSSEDISDILNNPNVYTDQSKIYERMKLSYYFKGRNKTLENFKPISEKIPFKFQYEMIKGSTKNRVEFLKFGIEK